MMTERERGKGELKIERRSYLVSLAILLLLMIFATILTRVIPAGEYQRVTEGGRLVLNPNSFHHVERVDYPIWRCFTAPAELLFAEGAVVIWMIILFLLFVGGSFSVLNRSGMVQRLMERILLRFRENRFRLLAGVSFFFMLFGSVFGIFEEMIILIPLCLVLAESFGWDRETGLAMSLLASGLGFSAATLNPFTLGVAQQVAALPAYSGIVLRLGVFASVYFLLLLFIFRHVKKLERGLTAGARSWASALPQDGDGDRREKLDRAIRVFALVLLLIPLLIVLAFFVKAISELLFPLIAVVFLVAACLAGKVSGYREGGVWRDLLSGFAAVAPAIVLILCASSIRYIMLQGKVMDSILHAAAGWIKDLSPFATVLVIYLFVMLLNFFISSGSAKALLVLPLIVPLTDLAGLTRQLAVQAFLFGDGFSNLLYPSNAALMIALGISDMSYPRWLRFSFPLQLALLFLSGLWLAICLAVGYGPF